VSDWERRDKRPGEWVLNTDHGSKRFYDAQEANKIAKRDGWGLTEKSQQELIERLAKPRTVRRPRKDAVATMKQTGFVRQTFYYANNQVETVQIPGRDPNKPLTEGEIRAEAVRLNYEHLYGWCNDQWRYIGVCVMCLGKEEDDPDTDVDLDYGDSKDLWGIEDNSDDYVEQVAHEHIDEFLCELAAEREAEAREATEALYWAQRDSMTGPLVIRVI
jgi:hypothetical protein